MKTERYSGECQVCEGTFKLKDGRMVHHGFTRPGVGHIIGDCPAVGGLPYEVSCDLLPPYLLGIRNGLKYYRGLLKQLNAGEIKTIAREERDRSAGYGAMKTVTYNFGEASASTWADVLQKKVWEVESEIKHLEHHEKRIDRRIKNWVKKPVRTTIEAVADARARSGLDERNEERRVKREAKEAKAAALKVKRDERTANRTALLAEIAGEFNRLAALPITHEVKMEAYAYAMKISAKKTQRFGYVWENHLGCDEALIKLGLASRQTSSPNTTYVNYHFSLNK